MERVSDGSTVVIAFKGTLESGEVFGESSLERPLSFTLGKDQMLRGVEEAIIGMSPGESKTTVIPPQKAFGIHTDDLVIHVDRKSLPKDFRDEVNEHIYLTDEKGASIPAKVIEVTDSEIVVDTNHPLAGQKLTLDIKLLEIE
jgi:peptidylprolyl isomerase